MLQMGDADEYSFANAAFSLQKNSSDNKTEKLQGQQVVSLRIITLCSETIGLVRSRGNRRPIVKNTILALSDKWLSLDARPVDKQIRA